MENLEFLSLAKQLSPKKIVKSLSSAYDKELRERINITTREYKNHKKNESAKIKGSVENFRASKKNEMEEADLLVLNDIKSQNFKVSRGRNNNRLSHTLTYASKRTLDSICFCNEPMVHIDLSCSQYAIFANTVLQILVKKSKNKIIGELDLFNSERGNILAAALDVLRFIYCSDCDITNELKSNTFYDTSCFFNLNDCNTLFNNLSIVPILNSYSNTIYINSEPAAPGPLKMYFNYENNKDLSLFLIGAINGTLYDDLSLEKNLASREEAKALLMKLFFGYFEEDIAGSDRYNLFPVTFHIVNSFKGHYAYKSLAKSKTKEKLDYFILKNSASELPIYLQQVEAEIFIDNILVKLYEQGLNVLSIHDSFLCPFSQYEKVLDTVYTELQKFLPFGFELKVKHPGAETEEKIKYVNEAVSVSQIISDYMVCNTDSARQERA